MEVVRFGALEVSVEVRSIVDLEPLPAAVVSPDDNYLSHGGGVSRIVWERAGDSMDREVAAFELPLALGDVVETTGGPLGARVLHAVTIDYDHNVRIRGRDLGILFARVLAQADAAGHRSLGLPLLGTGSAGVPIAVASAALTDAIAAVSRASLKALRRIAIAVRDESSASLVREVLLGQARVPTLEHLVANAAKSAPDRIAKSMRTAIEGLGSAKRDWALIALTEAAIHHLGATALKKLGENEPDPTAAADAVSALDASLRKRLLRPDGRLAPELPPGLAHGQLLEAARTLRQRAAIDLPPKVDAALRAAVEARNRFAHTAEPGAALDLERELLVVYAHLAGDAATAPMLPLGGGAAASMAPGLGGTSVVGVLAAARMWSQRREARVSAPAKSATASARPVDEASDGSHVRALVQFMRERLTPERRAQLDEELANDGYVGEPDLKLLEYAVRHEDPAGWLVDEFTRPMLRAELEARQSRKPEHDASSRSLAERLLEVLGFPRARQAHGLIAAISAVETARARIHGATGSEIRGLALACAGHLERVVLVLLRFVSIAAFDLPPELYFRKAHPGLLPDERALDRSSLGTVLALLEHLAKDFAQSEDPRVVTLRRDLQNDLIVPRNAAAIASLRNEFAHFREEPVNRPLEDLRRRAHVFVDAALELLRYLERPEHRVFPRVIRVKEIRTDAWRRRVVEAEDELGRSEFIFTSRPMLPGEVYYMHPLTNPFRVDPILVEAGDLASPAAGGRT